MMSMQKLGRFAMGASAILFVAACGDDSGPSTNNDISQAEAAVIGGEVTSQIGDLAGDLASFGNPAGGLGGGLFAPQALGGRMARMMGRSIPGSFRPQLAMFAAGDPNCNPTVTGDSTDTDGDGIPNGATYSFGAGSCTYQDSLGNGFALTGAIVIQDTDGGATLFGVNVAFNDWRVLFYTDSASAGFEYDGSSAITITSLAAISSQDVSARWRVNGQRVFAADHNWQLAFSPDTGAIDPATQTELPSGSFDITGDFTWSGNQGQADGTWNFSFDTPVAAHYNESCDTDPPLDAGQVRAAITGRNNIGFTVDYGPACGQETVNTFDAGTT